MSWSSWWSFRVSVRPYSTYALPPQIITQAETPYKRVLHVAVDSKTSLVVETVLANFDGIRSTEIVWWGPVGH